MRGSLDLEGLRAKYVAISKLRALHDRAKMDPTFHEPNPREAMIALARAWPGALRELDELPADEIRARIAELEAAIADASRIEPWMAAQDAFHRFARGALVAKRWLAKRKRVTREMAEAFAREHAATDAAIWASELAAIACPPRGRVMELVHARVARELGTTVAHARRLVLGAPRQA